MRKLERRALDRYLLERLKSYQRQADRDERAPRFASIFVTDRVGTQIASAFDDESVSESIGSNWAHRSYFHGGPVQLPKFPRPQPNAQHITTTHLSAVFLSNTQQKWKVAVSTPIYREDPDKPGQQIFEGILVLTLNLGDFEISRSELSPAHDRFAVLVDGRASDDQGTLLQHPLYNELQEQLGFLPQEFFGPEYRVPPALLAPGAGNLYEDPVSRYPPSSATKADPPSPN